MRKYRVLLPLLVNGEHGQGDVFEHEFTEADELENLRSGLLEVVPARYKVVGDSTVYDTPPGGEFDRALTIGEEAHLVNAGHVERVPDTKPAAKARAKKEDK
jgi:hypothetical protein